jgi:hypothetical protein
VDATPRGGAFWLAVVAVVLATIAANAAFFRYVDRNADIWFI